MPDRRPYASRGVPRRATSYRSGGAGSAAGPAALVVLLALIGVGFVWVADPTLFGLPATLIGSLSKDPGASKEAGLPRAPDARSTSGAGPVLQMAEIAPPAATNVSANSTAITIPTLRQWESSTAGLITDPVLAGRLDQALAGVDGQVSVAVKDLGSGRGAALDGDREMPAASLYKLTVLYSVFEAGLNMGEELPITEEARSYDSGSMELGVGETLSVAEALERMVTISDNTSAVMLGSRVGSNRINANIAALGMQSTHYSLERMTTSALDMLHLVDVVAQGKAVSTGASADMLHLLLRQRVNDRLPRLLPGDVQVAHKTGNLPGTVNDVGIVYGPSSTVTVAVLISDTTDETMAATAVARVAQAAYAYFGDQPDVSGRPTIPRAPARSIPPVWREPNPPTPTPTPTAEPSPVPSAAPVQQVVEPTPQGTAVRPPTPAPTVTAPLLAPAQSTSTATPAPHPATATPTPAPAQPTRTPTRSPTPGHH
jgi:beta-lactamase class A